MFNTYDMMRAAVEGTTDAIFIKDRDGHYLFINRAGAELIGKSADQILGKTDTDLFDAITAQATREREKRICATEKGETYEDTSTFRQTGIIHTFLTTKDPYRDSDERVIGIIGVSRDITGRKEAESESRRAWAEQERAYAALRQSEEQFRSAFDEAAIGMALVSTDGRWLRVNRSVCAMLGYSETELLQLDFQTLTHPDDLDADLEYVRQMLSGSRATYLMEKRYLHKSGRIVWAALSVSLVRSEPGGMSRSEEGKPLFFISQIQNITERRHSEEKLHQTMTKARCLFWNARVYDDPASPGGRLWEIEIPDEAAARRWLPVRMWPGAKYSEAWHESKHPEDRKRMLACHTAALSTGQDHYAQEFRCLLATGEERWISEEVQIEVAQPGEWRLVGVCMDITERKRLQEQILQKEKLASLGELVAGVAHELNNPLAAISGTAQLLNAHPDRQVQEDAATIRAMTDRASRIVRGLRDFARHGDSEERQSCALNLVVETALEMMKHKLQSARIELDLHLSPDLPVVLINEIQIEQVLINLLGNAEYALRSQSDPRCITIRTAEGGSEPWLSVTVTDNGCGIPEEVLPRIFDPFFTTKDVGEGTGLGLSISHGIVAAHRGQLTVQSEPGVGTTFTLLLPVSGSNAP